MILAHLTRDFAIGHAMGFALGLVAGALVLLFYVFSRFNGDDDDDRTA